MNKPFIYALLILCLFIFPWKIQAQNEKVKLSGSNITLKTAFEQVEKQTGFSVDYDTKTIDVTKVTTPPLKELTISEMMDFLLKNTEYAYTIKKSHIIITEKAKEAVSSKPIGTRTCSGTVYDTKGEPLMGAAVKVEGTTNGTITDINGKYMLTNVPPHAKLSISYVGYKPRIIEQDNAAKITLEEDTKIMDEVVVVGYGAMKKRDLTGAVTSVKMNDEPLSTISTISHALAGKAAGLQVTTISAQPGGQATFRVRGAASSGNVGNDPLIIIDGFPVSNPGNLNTGNYNVGNIDNILGSINPNDIESIEILKDASSTAIYGARAGNGVIIVTTKKGKSGKPIVKYSGGMSWQKMADSYEMLNATDFMTQVNRYGNENWLRTNRIAPYGNTLIGTVAPYVPKYSKEQIENPVNQTDWLGAVTRPGFQTQHNISISGGSDYTKYMLSGNYFLQNGVVKNNNLNRFTTRINIEQKISNYVKAGINFTISRNNFDNVPLGTGQNESAPILVGAVQFNPLLPIKNAADEYQLNPEATFMPNPVSLLDITNKNTKERLLSTVFVEIEPIKNLFLKANVGIDRNYQKVKTYLPKTTLPGKMEGGKADIAQSDNSDYLMDLTATYTKKMNEHNFSVMAGHSFQQFNNQWLYAGNKQFLIDGYLFNNLGAGVAPKPEVGSSAGKGEIASFFGRVNYSFRDRYLLTATIRTDGASNFAEKYRWATFPAISMGWRFIDEEFAKPLTDILSNGKFRLGYGESGKSNIGNAAISFYKSGGSVLFGNETESKGVYLDQLGNPSVKWEKNKEWNIGLDLGFLNNKISITAEYFTKVVDGWLSKRNLQSYMIVNTIADNIGSTQSRGFELTVNTRNVDTKYFVWTTDFTYSFYRDTWKDRGPYWKPAVYSIYNAPLRGNYGYLSDGLIQASDMDANGNSKIVWMPGALPGQVKLKDIDGFERNTDGTAKVGADGRFIKTGKPDGRLDDADVVFYGDGDPRFSAGLNNTFRFKNWDLNIYFYGQFNKLNWGSYKDLWLTGADGMTGVINIYRGYNMPTSVTDVWTHDNPNATRPGFFQDKSSYGIGDYYLKRISFIRCRNITLGYTFPKTKFYSNIRVYADVNNPFVLTNYNGLDPETDNSVWAYPNVRTASLGVDITF